MVCLFVCLGSININSRDMHAYARYFARYNNMTSVWSIKDHQSSPRTYVRYRRTCVNIIIIFFFCLLRVLEKRRETKNSRDSS